MVQAEYVYNAQGQQVVQWLTQAGQTIHSVFDLDGNRIAEYDYDPSTQVSTLLREYIWMDGAAVAVVEGGVVYYIRTDQIGRPAFANDGTGTKVWTATYLPFGGAYASTGTPIALRFPGQWFQSESGLHQNWMRDYDPTTGRYIQADPLGLVDGASVYGYARQNPGRYVDPRGEFIVPIAGAIAGGAASAGLQYAVNRFYGNMTREQAIGCINIIPVATGAAFGASGLGVLGLLIKRQARGAGLSAAISSSFNSSVPPVYIDEDACGCEVPDLPNWIKALKNLALI